MPTYTIPFNKPTLAGSEMQYAAEAILNGHSSGDGPFGKRCQELLETTLGAPKALLTTSCTHALEMSAMLINAQPGDEVIVPAFTFVSTANAFALRGARPVFIDIRPDTLNLDERQIESLITPRTKGIVPVHYAGVGCEMDEIMAIAARHGLRVIEDNAHGMYAKYRGRYLGTLGHLAAQSFHETKNIICGEGGALVINDPQYVERADVVRDKGTNRKRFLRGQVDKYSWVDIGSSYSLSDILAAFLLAQLEKREEIRQKRKAIWECYHQSLEDWASAQSVGRPQCPPHCEPSYHMYYLVLPSLTARLSLTSCLAQRGILSLFHFVPLHTSEMGRRFGARAGQCPETERVSECLLRLPFYNSMTGAEQSSVIGAIREFAY